MGSACPGRIFSRTRDEPSQDLLPAPAARNVAASKPADLPSLTAKEMLAPERCFYMNFKLLNVAEFLPKVVRAKLRSAGKSDTTVTLAGKGMGLLARRPKAGTDFGNKIADKLTELMPYKLEENGIFLKLTKVHCGETGFIVLRAEVVHIDVLKLLEAAKGTECAAKLAPLIGVVRKFKDIDRALVPKVEQLMMQKMSGDIPKMLYEKARLKMLMIAKTSSEQADFFFDALAPHKFEIAWEISNRAEAGPQLAEEHAKGQFGSELGRGKLLGELAGSVARKVVANATEETFEKLASRRLSVFLPEFLADVGVTLSVVEAVTATDASGSGSNVLRCEIRDVDLDAFRVAAGVEMRKFAGSMPQGQHMLELGQQGRSRVYVAIREYMRVELPFHFYTQKGLSVSVVIRDLERNGVPEMMEIEGLSDDEGEA